MRYQDSTKRPLRGLIRGSPFSDVRRESSHPNTPRWTTVLLAYIDCGTIVNGLIGAVNAPSRPTPAYHTIYSIFTEGESCHCDANMGGAFGFGFGERQRLWNQFRILKGFTSVMFMTVLVIFYLDPSPVFCAFKRVMAINVATRMYITCESQRHSRFGANR
ncbi:uncharacterized protein BDW43DRAFT_267465 [Aspergillus alliaceus]|uniref:uncharacterized protein n=1 Tax=Petromyces alliaceus TaxID=209559 RepID=UPI0012A40350|nr:uncharacterized protein BDW43DRAFT_267465 [Aspergillus alliaceus]KAB8236690.1 hypothetical protein BDW43DRAFT_267465 [Aspergillus alliaceus]